MEKRSLLFFGMTVGSSVVLIGGVLLGTAFATHETEHRFTVFGYVRDDQGRTIPNARVIVANKRLDQANTTFSDNDGYYEALLHMHNESLGDEIAVMAGDKQKTIRAQFDPEDHKTERKVQVDFGAPASSAPVAQGPPVWMYGGGAAVVLLLAAAVWVSLSRKQAAQRVQQKFQKKGKKKR